MTDHKSSSGIGQTVQDTVATLADLQSMRREIHDEMSGLRQDIASFQREIQSFLNRKSETNWSTVLTALSILLLIAGMAATLIWSLIQSESQARFAAVEAIVSRQAEITARIDENVAEDREQIRELDTVMQREMRLLDEVLQREMALHVSRIDELIRENKLGVKRNESAIERLDERGTHVSRMLLESSQ